MKRLGLKFNVLEVGAIDKNSNYLTWDMINMMKSGLVDFGAHTYNHVYLTEIKVIYGSRDI